MLDAKQLKQEFLLCLNCNKDYDDECHRPRVLRCLHVLCEDCAKGSLDGTNIQCPKCHEKYPLSADGIEGLPVETTWRRLKDFVDVNEKSSNIPCKECPDDNKANTFCKDCSIFFCTECSTHHVDPRNRNARGHVVVKLEELQSADLQTFQRQSQCPEHPDQQQTFYCDSDTCHQPICVACTVVKHDKTAGHKLRTIPEVYPEKVDYIKGLVHDLDEQELDIKGATKVLNGAKSSLQKQKQDKIEDINAEFEECKKILENRRQILRNNVESQVGKLNVGLDRKLEELQEDKAQRLDAKYFAEHILQVSNKVEFLQLAQHITNQLEQLRQREFCRNPIEKHELCFAPKVDTDKLKDLCKVNDTIKLNSLSVWRTDVETYNATENQKCNIARVKLHNRHGDDATYVHPYFKAMAKDATGESQDVEVNEESPANFMLMLTPRKSGRYTLHLSLLDEKQEGEEYTFVVDAAH